DGLPGGRCGAAPLSRLLVRRRALVVRRDVRAEPGASGERAPARGEAGRADRPRELDARRLRRPALRADARLRASAGGAALPHGLGVRDAPRGAVRTPGLRPADGAQVVRISLPLGGALDRGL